MLPRHSQSKRQQGRPIVGDDDQAIFEWRGATPEYILNPKEHFGKDFRDYQLDVNYRSPKNIVNLSRKLIRHNTNRVDKTVKFTRTTSPSALSLSPTSSTTRNTQGKSL